MKIFPNAKLDWTIFFDSISLLKVWIVFFVEAGKFMLVGDLVLFESVIIVVN